MYSKYLERYGVVYSALRFDLVEEYGVVYLALHLDLALSVELVRECPEVLGTAELVRLDAQYSHQFHSLEKSLRVL